MFLQIYKILINFDPNPLICDPTLLPSKNSPNIAKSNCVFPGKRKENRALILTYLNSLTAKVFPLYSLFFRFGPSSGGNGWLKLDQKWKLWVRLFFMKTRIPQIFFKQCFCLLQYYLWWEFWQYDIIFGGVRAQNLPKRAVVRKTLKTFNLTITNDIVMKLTTIMYLHESVNRKSFGAKISVFWRNVYEFLDYIKNCHLWHALPCVASLVKFLYKFHEKPTKMIATLSSLTRLCNFMRPYIWWKTRGVNQGAPEDVA